VSLCGAVAPLCIADDTSTVQKIPLQQLPTEDVQRYSEIVAAFSARLPMMPVPLQAMRRLELVGGSLTDDDTGRHRVAGCQSRHDGAIRDS
jgi:hypothetical protein